MPEKSQTENLIEIINDLENRLQSYRVMIDNTPDLLYRTDLEGRITFVSGSVEALSGYTVEEAIGMKMADEVYLHPHQRDTFLKQLQEKGQVKNFQAQLKRKDQTIWWASTNAHIYKNEQGELLGVEGVTRDVSDIKKAEEAQRKSEELFRLAFQTSPDSINLNRASDGLYIDINEGFTKIMGYTREDAIGKTSVALNIWHNSEDRKRLIDELQRNGFVENLEAEFVGKDGKIRIGLMSARLLQIAEDKVILSITRDITERKQLEQQLQQAQKFEALGTLAGGIAHDFNNILMGIQGRASLIAVSLAPENPLLEHVQSIEEYVSSATNLTRQILGFARAGKYETNPVDINEFIRKCAAMYGRTNKDVTIHIQTGPEPVVVEADQQQLEQVFLNVFVNAKQAMPRGGDLYLESLITDLGDQFSAFYGVSPGKYCKISIIDKGTGMDEETQHRAFDPFFTTKDKERGTGLGLASAKGIIKNHGGAITLTSELGLGTTVELYLPLSHLQPIEQEISDASIVKGAGSVLLVDDEHLVTEVGEAMLAALGYDVLISHSGLEAIQVLSEKEISIDLVILDLIMPGMDGEKTFQAIHKIDPRLPVLLSSGYSMNGQVLDIMQKGCKGFIQKPFNLQELSHKIQEILNK